MAEAPGLRARCTAEGIGTFALVFAGCGAIVSNQLTGGAGGHVGVSLTFRLVILVMVYARGHLSGAHFNPAVTLGFAVARHFPPRELAAYWGAQFTGATSAAAVLRGLFPTAPGLGQTRPAGPAWQSFWLEVLLTFFLMFVIMAVATDARAIAQGAPLAIGGTIPLAALFAGPISGASMNPARSFGPAVVSGDLAALWIYWLAPGMGACGGALSYKLCRR